MKDILARATSEPPKRPGAFASLCASVETIARRLLALEQRPLPRDGVDGLPGARGDVGAVGPIGPRGDAGPQGQQGPMGEPGLSAPVFSLGSELSDKEFSDRIYAAIGVRVQIGDN